MNNQLHLRFYMTFVKWSYFPTSKITPIINQSFVCTGCSYHVTYAFQSEFILYICLSVMALLARSRREM